MRKSVLTIQPRIWLKLRSGVSILSALLSPVTYIITNAAIILIIWFGAQNVNAGNGMLSGDIIALVNYMTQILLAMIAVANLVVLLTKRKCKCGKT